MKKLALSLATVLALASSVKAETFVYNGPARIQVATSEEGARTVLELVTAKGYTPIKTYTSGMILMKDGVTYAIERVETNKKGLITFVKFAEIKRGDFF